MIVDQDHLSGGGSWVTQGGWANMAAEFALAVVQETLERLDSCQLNGDYSGILLRLEYLNRTIINCGDLPNSFLKFPTAHLFLVL